MNIFYLHKDPVIAASYLCDKHMKMCLETAQILSTVSWRYNVPAPYKASHKNHPSVLWAGDSLENWKWLVSHGIAIGEEYTKRYGKIHKSSSVIKWCLNSGGRPTSKGFAPPPQCMPEQYRDRDTVFAYRSFYLKDKVRFAKWNYGSKPNWWIFNE